MVFKRRLPAGVDAADAEEGRMPFLAHLGELRQRIMVCLIALMIGFALTFSFSERIINYLARPLEPVKLAFLEPTEPFWVNMKVALVAGAFLVLPVLLSQVWGFIASSPCRSSSCRRCSSSSEPASRSPSSCPRPCSS
jgi:Sec-independent protein secretion pathway component TatC